MSFAPNAPVVMTGDDHGTVSVYKLVRVFSEPVLDRLVAQLMGSSASLYNKENDKSYQAKVLEDVLISKNQLLENKKAKSTTE